MDSPLKNQKFGVVHTSPTEMLTKNLEVGKLYFAQGDASGAAKQGIYALTNSSDVDGVNELTMFGTGAVADGTGYGLSQANFTTDEKNKLAGIAANANNYSLPLAATNTRGGIQVGFTANDASIPVLLSGEDAYVQLTKTSIEKGLGYTINASVPSNAKFTDTDTWRAINVNGEQKIANNVSTALDISAGNNIEVSFNDNKVVIATKNVDASNADHANTADHATNATNASTADKVAQSFDVSFGGANILSFNGSKNKTLAFKEGSNIDINNFNGILTISTTGVPTTTEMTNAINSALSSALQYKGTVKDGSVLPTTNKVGDVYVASGAYTTTQNSISYKCESGDLFIWNGTYFDIVNGENQVVNGNNGTNATLTPGENNIKIATVDGTDIKVNVPELPSIVNTLNDKSGALTTSYDTSISSTANGAYRAGTLTIAGKTHIIYGKDTDTVYTHPASINGTTAVNTSDGGDFAFSTSNKTLQVITGAQRDASGHISKLIYKDITLPENAYLNDNTVYTHPVVGTTNTQTDTSVLTAVTLNSETEFTVVNGVYRDASGHVNKVSTTKYTMPASAFTDTKCASLTLNVDSSADVPATLYADVISNTKITASGSGTELTGTMTSVRVATQAAVEAAKEAATIYWETL